MKTERQPPLENKYAVVRHWRVDGGWYMAVVKRLHRRGKEDHLAVMHIEAGMTIKKYPLAEEKYFKPMPEYPLDKACKGMLQSGTRLGITKGAQALLREGIEYAKEQRKGLDS